MQHNSLKGLRTLVIEDESIVSMFIEDTLADIGCVVAGTASRLDEALHKVASVTFDAVVLNLNLNGALTHPVADAIVAKGRPFIFSTGYGSGGLPNMFPGVPVLTKPFLEHDLARALIAAIATKD